MRKILPFVLFVLLSIEAFAGGRPIAIIECVSRGEAAITFLKDGSILKASLGDTTDRLCYPAPLNITGDTPADLCVGDATTLHSIFLTGDKMGVDTLLPGDAITVSAFTNFNLTEDPNNLVGATTGDFRTAFIAIPDPADPTRGIVEVEFTRDPFQASTITFASATLGGAATYTIPACVTVAPISAVPTLGEWGLMSLGLILLIFGVNAIRQTVTKKTIVN